MYFAVRMRRSQRNLCFRVFQDELILHDTRQEIVLQNPNIETHLGYKTQTNIAREGSPLSAAFH